jgi:hypothetical protein
LCNLSCILWNHLSSTFIHHVTFHSYYATFHNERLKKNVP